MAQRTVEQHDPDIFETFNRPPPASLLEGNATLNDAKVWVYSEGLGRIPDGGVTLPADFDFSSSTPDLNLDGVADLLIVDDRRSGTGGRVYAAFLTTPNGYRYIGTFLAQIVLPVADNSPDRVRIVPRQHLSADTAIYRLAELHADGLHETARVTLNTRDAEVGRMLNRLGGGGVASPDILPLAIGDAP